MPRVGTDAPLTVTVVGNGWKLWSCSTTWFHFALSISGKSPASLPVLCRYPVSVALLTAISDTSYDRPASLVNCKNSPATPPNGPGSVYCAEGLLLR